MGMDEYRQHINEIDEQIVKLYKERLAVADEIALFAETEGLTGHARSVLARSEERE